MSMYMGWILYYADTFNIRDPKLGTKPCLRSSGRPFDYDRQPGLALELLRLGPGGHLLRPGRQSKWAAHSSP